jgi:hypothetical protein
MKDMTFEQQMKQHVQFLQNEGLEVSSLMINSSEFIRSKTKEESGRGEYAYKTASRVLDNGMIGLITWCRGKNGKINTYKTYGRPHNGDSEKTFQTTPQSIKIHLEADLKKIQAFWELSSPEGVSDYLTKKEVGSYRIRFRDNKYGRVAIVPVVDIGDQLCGYQILNANGSKVFAKGMQLNGAFHQLTKLTDQSAIGIAESYVTAATCLELVGMPMVTALTSNNLEHVAVALRKRYPKSFLVIFADNDMHLIENKGIVSAIKAQERIKSDALVLTPQFESSKRGRDYSDWNDLVRERGRVVALEQIIENLRKTQDDRIKEFYIKLKNS